MKRFNFDEIEKRIINQQKKNQLIDFYFISVLLLTFDQKFSLLGNMRFDADNAESMELRNLNYFSTLRSFGSVVKWTRELCVMRTSACELAHSHKLVIVHIRACKPFVCAVAIRFCQWKWMDTHIEVSFKRYSFRCRFSAVRRMETKNFDLWQLHI